ncbi:MAG TPA: hypothetical protein DCP38_08230 [Acidobacteria bacterium]|nr:hypothetical protein [Acidobacteriota bacterium]
MRDIERPDDLLLVLRALLRCVGRDDDRALVDDLVETLVRREDLVERVFDGDAGQGDRVLPILKLLVVGDVDPGRIPDEVQDVSQVRVDELHGERFARRRVQQQRGRGLVGLLAHLLDGRPRPRGLDPIADEALQLGHLGRGLLIARIEFAGLAILERRRRQFVARLELTGPNQMRPRGVEHRPFERDLVVDAFWIVLDRLREVRHRGVPVAVERSHFPLLERPTRRASRHHHGQHHDREARGMPPCWIRAH